MNSPLLSVVSLSTLTLTLSLLPGCTKYEQDGALVQFRRPEKRILGTWTSASVTEVGTDADTNVTEFLTSNNLQLEAIFEEGGVVTFENIGEELRYEGTWAFNEDNSVLHLDLESLKPTGPFFFDQDSLDRTLEMESALAYLQNADTLFVETGTFTDITSEVVSCVNLLSQTGFQWTLVQGSGENGTLTVNGEIFYPGDAITGWVLAVIDDSLEDWIDDGAVTDAQDYDGIANAIASDYNAEISYFNQKNPVLTGLDDPNLFAEIQANCNLSAEMYVGSPEDILSEVVLAYVNDNNDFNVTVTYSEVLRLMDVYWQILELEQDDMQAYQFREYVEGVTVYDYSFLLRFEKE
ncbi:MAG: hypothetical protein ACPF87_04350 [Flavobacteriales bacterium]